MTVERLLQIHVAVLGALGTTLLGMGQRDPVLPILSIFASITSVYFTDTLRWFVMSRTLGNIAALGAVLIASFQFWSIASDQQLLAIANLLVYLQLILLYQQKNATRYWEIAVLSLLQVVVAAALNLGFQFGVLLVLYMLTAFSALSLFFVYREGLQFCAPEADELPPAAPAKKRSLRRQLLGDPVQLSPLTPQTTFSTDLMGWNFARNVTALGFMTIVFTVVLFFAVPRTSNAVWQGHGEAASQTGFAPEVTLNEPGQVRQSDEVVMRVTFRKPGSKEPMMISGEPYFYGTVLTHYGTDAGVSRWSNPNTGRGNGLRPVPYGAEVTYQEAVINTSGEPILFSTPAAYASELMTEDQRSKLRFDWRSGQLRRRGEDNGSRAFAYSVATTGFKGNWQLPVTQHQVPADVLAESPFVAQQVVLERETWLLAIDRERFPTLIAKAEKVLGGKLKPSERVVAARLLQDHFRTPDAYNYTLDFSQIPRKPDVDPIEDFVANHRTGHCEYFASALCLMLRSQGIPARIVVGYKGGEFNSVGGYYWVRQLHAHAWVEAFLEKDQIPEGAIDPKLVTETGAWLRLDPTPASSGPEQLTVSVSMLARVGDAMDYMQLLWDDYVLGLNSERQKKAIYAPLGDGAVSVLGGMLDPNLWQERAQQVAEKLGIRDRGQIFSWRGGLAASVATALLVLLYQGATVVWRWCRAWWQRRKIASAAPQRKVVEFYQRLEYLLAQLGIRRDPHQTQREFALAASLRLAALGPEAGEVVELPSAVVDAFYRVRFGENALDEAHRSNIERSLAKLGEFVARPKPTS